MLMRCIPTFLAAFISRVYDSCFPLVRVSRKRSKDKKWVTPGIIKSSIQKSKLYKSWISSQNISDSEKYKNYVKIFNKLVCLARSNYYRNIFDLKLNSIKSVWKEISAICSHGSRKNNNINISKIEINGTIVTDQKKQLKS